MSKFSGFVCALVAGVSLLVGAAAAQTPTIPTPPAPKDELVQAWLDTVKVAAQFANNECQQLDAVKQFNSLRAAKQKQVEDRLAGYTVDWSTFSVVPKRAVPSVK
jgi:hypothetical protein